MSEIYQTQDEFAVGEAIAVLLQTYHLLTSNGRPEYGLLAKSCAEKLEVVLYNLQQNRPSPLSPDPLS